MISLKCKMCGGTVEFESGATVGVCDSCGTKQTLPRLDDDRKANLYDRANHFRRNNEYDKAMSIYEQILNEDSTDAESYWSIVLCKYGIEYVEDPTTHKRVPTVNRAQFTSVVADEDYKKAIEYADISQKIIYEEEAAAIDQIQKGILEISEKEEPFDVFICYKETDNNGSRTQDSVLANDLYYQLVQEGFKVFFSRITLEDKLGSAYEPYIFAALNSAKVMVVLGTNPEHFNAVWVKNEWSRYLSLVKLSHGKKVLIPAYKDMDPYDLPEEFSHLQAQDMTKIGFMQDLIRGIKKIIGDNDRAVRSDPSVAIGSVQGANIAALLTRGNNALEDGSWNEANEYFDKVLDNNAECAEAYLGLFLAENKMKSIEEIVAGTLNRNNDASSSSKVLLNGGDKEHVAEIINQYSVPGYLSANDIESAYKYDLSYESDASYWKSKKSMIINELNNDRKLSRALQYSSSELRRTIEKTFELLENKFDEKISEAVNKDKATADKKISDYYAFLDKTDKKVKVLYKQACEKRDNDSKAKRNFRKSMINTLIVFAVIVCLALVLIFGILPAVNRSRVQKEAESTYLQATQLMASGNYEEAEVYLAEISDYKDSRDLYIQCRSNRIPLGYEIMLGTQSWVVIDRSGNDFLLVCKDSVGERRFNEENDLDEWSSSSIREWLNNDWLNECFSEENATLVSYIVSSEDLPDDKVFLLDEDDIDTYRYYIQQLNYTGEWWLRTTLGNGCTATCCGWVATVYDGYRSTGTHEVRPAMWFDLADYQIDTGMLLVVDEELYDAPSIPIGYEFEFGNYNGSSIKWIVIDQDDDGYLVIASNVVSDMPYDSVDIFRPWTDTDLYGWLNDDFMSGSFSDEESTYIINGEIDLLGSGEINGYQDIIQYFGEDCYPWWLNDCIGGQAFYVDFGFVRRQMDPSETCGVRPVLRIDLRRYLEDGYDS